MKNFIYKHKKIILIIILLVMFVSSIIINLLKPKNTNIINISTDDKIKKDNSIKIENMLENVSNVVEEEPIIEEIENEVISLNQEKIPENVLTQSSDEINYIDETIIKDNFESYNEEFVALENTDISDKESNSIVAETESSNDEVKTDLSGYTWSGQWYYKERNDIENEIINIINTSLINRRSELISEVGEEAVSTMFGTNIYLCNKGSRDIAILKATGATYNSNNLSVIKNSTVYSNFYVYAEDMYEVLSDGTIHLIDTEFYVWNTN